MKYCINCGKRLPLIFGRSKRIKAIMFEKTTLFFGIPAPFPKRIEVEFCSADCSTEFSCEHDVFFADKKLENNFILNKSKQEV